jgi:peroxiredoxin
MAAFFESHDVRVFIIGSGLRPVAAAVSRLLSSPHTILYDADRTVYRSWGLEKRMGLIQMSGTFLIDPAGIIDYAHAVLNPFDSFRKREIIERIS